MAGFLWLVESSDFEDGEAQSVGHQLARLFVAQGKDVDILPGIGKFRIQVADVEIEQAEEKHGRIVVIPFPFLPSLLRSRFGDGEGRVEEGSFQEILLLGNLHLNDELPVVTRFAEEVEDGFAVLFGETDLFALPDVDIRDVEAKDGVERADDEVLVAGFLEDLLESEIDHGVDVLVDHVIRFHSSIVFAGVVAGRPVWETKIGIDGGISKDY